jgi:hypothetical protein
LGRGRIHQLLWRVSQPVTMRLRSLAARDNEKLFRTGSSNTGWFRACANRSHPEGARLLLCASTGHATLAVPRTRHRPNERRRKAGQSERANRGGHGIPVKFSPAESSGCCCSDSYCRRWRHLRQKLTVKVSRLSLSMYLHDSGK